MQASYWHQKWEKGETNFHQFKGSPLLKAYFARLELSSSSRLFVPLCGKTRDIPWLLGKGHHVVAAELHEPAVRQLFADMEVEPEITQLEDYDLLHYRAQINGLIIDVYVGDIFALTKSLIGQVDAIYDRASLVALPSEMRQKYTEHMRQLTDCARQLLISFDYEQHLLPGPPYCVNSEEVNGHYANEYIVTLLASEDVVGGLKGKLKAKEEVWLLRKNA
jgi:thiopurine S-methyltransferase